MERALLDVEHNNELKNIQNDEAKLKHLQQEHQIRVEAFNLHTAQVNKYFMLFNSNLSERLRFYSAYVLLRLSKIGQNHYLPKFRTKIIFIQL